MDQLFDRLGTLLKSFITPDEDRDSRPFSDSSHTRSGDPFLDDAMEELDAFLGDDREKQERLRTEREARAKAQDEARSRRSGAASSAPPRKLLDAYRALGLAYGAPFTAVRTAYKKLLKEHHPDRHGSDPGAQKRATETSARINNAYRIIETWKETGTLGDE
ncbi:MAG: J domain-containing protein [Spirochaetales bacterium]|nr:MAG: J domain-containing protein [Spirochaetales bacterium]